LPLIQPLVTRFLPIEHPEKSYNVNHVWHNKNQKNWETIDAHYDSLKQYACFENGCSHHTKVAYTLLMIFAQIWNLFCVRPVPNASMIHTWNDHYSVINRLMWEKLFNLARWEVTKFKQVPYFENEFGFWDEEYCWLLTAK